MEHRGFDINVVQTITGGEWKWLVQLPAQRRHGEACTRDLAIFAARKAIDGALAPHAEEGAAAAAVKPCAPALVAGGCGFIAGGGHEHVVFINSHRLK